MRNRRRQREAAYAALAIHTEPYERTPLERYRRLPWGVLAPRVFVAMVLGLALSLPRLVAALIASKQIGTSAEGDKTTFLADFANRPPSVANLPDDVTINGKTVAPFMLYDGADATSTQWPARYGVDLEVSGTGTTPEPNDPYHPFHGSADGCVRQKGTDKHYYSPSAKPYTLGTTDQVFEVVWWHGDTGVDVICSQRAASGARWTAFTNCGTFYVVFNDGTDEQVIATVVGLGWNHVIVTQDYSGSGKIYLNGVASGLAVVRGSTTAPDAAAAKFEIGGWDAVGPYYSRAVIARITGWQGASWLDSHLQPTLAAERFALLTGQTAAKAKGNSTPTLATRSDSILLRKEHPTLGTLWIPAAANWPTNNHDENGVSCLEVNASQVCGPYNNGDLDAWTKAGTASVAATTAPDGTSRNCRVTLGDSSNGLTSTGGLTAATTCALGISVRRVTGDTGTLTIENSEGAAYGQWTIALADLTADKNAWLTAADARVTVVAPFVPNAGAAGVAIYGTECDCCFPTLVQDVPQNFAVVRPVLTAGALRTTGAETRAYTEDSANVPSSGMRITLDCAVDNVDAADAVLAQISDGGGAAEIVQLRCEGTGDYGAATVTTGSSVVADVQGTTDIADGTRRTLVGVYRANDVRLRVAGTAEGTPDTSAARPSGLDRIEVGHSSARVYSYRVEAA